MENASLEKEIAKLRKENEEFKRRENAFRMRLAVVEQHNHELELKLEETNISAQAPYRHSSLLDPAVNKEFRRLQQELIAVRTQLKTTQEELDSVRFTPSSTWGKRLVAKCKVLQDENQEFAKVLSEGTVRWLESELARERAVSEELRRSQRASQELIHQLMEEIDAAYSALHALRAQLPTNASLPAGTREILARANQGAGATRGPSPTPPDQPQQPHPLQELAATPVPPLPTDPQVGQTGLPPQQPAQPRADSPPARPESAMNLEERAVGK